MPNIKFLFSYFGQPKIPAVKNELWVFDHDGLNKECVFLLKLFSKQQFLERYLIVTSIYSIAIWVPELGILLPIFSLH